MSRARSIGRLRGVDLKVIYLPNLPRIILKEGRIPRGVRLPCSLRVRGRKGKVVFGDGVAISKSMRAKRSGE
jgi:hypothetical protein